MMLRYAFGSLFPFVVCLFNISFLLSLSSPPPLCLHNSCACFWVFSCFFTFCQMLCTYSAYDTTSVGLLFWLRVYLSIFNNNLLRVHDCLLCISTNWNIYCMTLKLIFHFSPAFWYISRRSSHKFFFVPIFYQHEFHWAHTQIPLYMWVCHAIMIYLFIRCFSCWKNSNQQGKL